MLFSIVIIFQLSEYFFALPKYANDFVKVTGFIIVILGAGFFVVKAPKLSARKFKIVAVIAVCLAVVSHIIVAHALYSTSHSWDVGAVHKLAINYIETGTTETPGAWEQNYLAKYDNNVPITLFLTLIFKAVSLFGISNFALCSQVINSAAILGAFFMMIVAAYKLFGRRAAALAYVFGFILIIISAYAPITYTDTLGMFFVAAMLLAMVVLDKASGKKRLALSCLLGLLLVFGYLIKPTTAILFIAFVVVVLAKNLPNITRKGFLKKGIAILLSLIAGLVVGWALYTVALGMLPNFAKYSTEQIDRYKTPIEHYIGMGALRGLGPWTGCKNGGYCSDYVDWVQSEDGLKSLADRKEYALSLWQDSVTAGSPFDYLGFVIKKAVISFSDGSFGIWQEGGSLNNQIVFFDNNDIDVTIRQFIGPDGRYLNRFKALQYAVWLAILVIIVVSAVFVLKDRRLRQNLWLNVFYLTAIGLCLYLMLFECRARYAFLYLPVFIMLASGGLGLTIRKTYRSK